MRLLSLLLLVLCSCVLASAAEVSKEEYNSDSSSDDEAFDLLPENYPAAAIIAGYSVAIKLCICPGDDLDRLCTSEETMPAILEAGAIFCALSIARELRGPAMACLGSLCSDPRRAACRAASAMNECLKSIVEMGEKADDEAPGDESV